MPSNDESTETGTAANAVSEAVTNVTAAGSSHPSPPIEAEPVFIGHLPDGYEIPYGVTVHVLEPDETGALRDHQMSEDSIARVDPVTHQVQHIYHGQVIDAEHPPAVPEGNPAPEPIFIGEIPDHFQMPYGQTVHVLVQNEDGALVDRRVQEEPIGHVNKETGEREVIWHGQVIDPLHPPAPSEGSVQPEPVFVGHVPDGYQFQPGVTVHVLEASPDSDGLRDHRIVEEPIMQTDRETGDTLTIWHGTVIDRQHHDSDNAPHHAGDSSEHGHDASAHSSDAAGEGTTGHE
ncbi:MAG: hypothetical protein M3081_04375 [Gemmatimonadota bacterium]|nr:hypothetical protein [Gemmatimonadota bacterium]